MKKLIIVIFVIFLGLVVNPTKSTASHIDYIVDQESGGMPNGSYSIPHHPTLGQSFTPTFSSIGIIEVYIYDYIPDNSYGINLNATLHANYMGVPIATTLPVTLPDSFSDFVIFKFPSHVPIVPGQQYFMEINYLGDCVPHLTCAENFGLALSDSGNSYPGGTFFYSESILPAHDVWFKEGIVPEPSTMLLLGSGLLGLVVVRRKLRRKP